MLATVIAIALLGSGQEIRKGLATRTPVLTYHDVVAERGPGTLWFDCSVSELKSQLDWLTARGAHFISIEQLYRHLTEGTPLPPKAIAITFADNYLGFYQRALPILRQRHIPTTMFVHTDYVGSPVGRPKMNWDQLIELDREGLVTIASQTRTHPADLRSLSDKALREEMVGSKRILESKLGHPVRFLAYPNGKFDARVAQAAKDAGYDMAFTEQLMPSERSPSIYMVARYVHTKYQRAWSESRR